MNIDKQLNIKYPYKVEEIDLSNGSIVSMVRFNSLDKAKDYCRKYKGNYSIHKYNKELYRHDYVCSVLVKKV